MTTVFEVTSARGSTWHRWDPHLHTPGAALNDQYSGTDPWGDCFQKIEQSDPPIRALGITDYYSIDNYLKVVAWRMSGRLSGVGLVFPNVEIRLSIETNKAGAINLHLLFCPAVADHVARIRHFLADLEMTYLGEKYRCTREDFVRLGRVHKPSLPNDDAAYEEGAT